MKSLAILATIVVCGIKLSVTQFTTYNEYAGVVTGPHFQRYNLEIANPKSQTLTIDSIFAQGRWIDAKGKEVSGDPIKFQISRSIKEGEPAGELVSPLKNQKAAVAFKIKGKTKQHLLGIDDVQVLEDIARP